MSTGPTTWPEGLAPFFVVGAGAAAQPLASASTQVPHRSQAHAHALLTFCVGDAPHALPIRDVVEVCKLARVTRLPKSHPGVLGLMSLRGSLVPVVHLAHYFAKPGTAPDAGALRHVVVLGDASAPVGLAVGTLVGVHRLPEAAVVPRPGAALADTEAVTAFATTPQGEVVAVLAAAALLRRFAEL